MVRCKFMRNMCILENFIIVTMENPIQVVSTSMSKFINNVNEVEYVYGVQIFLYIRRVWLIKVKAEIAQNNRAVSARIAEFQQVRKFFEEQSETQLVFSTG